MKKKGCLSSVSLHHGLGVGGDGLLVNGAGGSAGGGHQGGGQPGFGGRRRHGRVAAGASAAVAVAVAVAARRGGRVERALAAEMAQQSLAVPRQSQRFEEGRPELGRHDVVQDGVDGRVEVEHDPAEVEPREPGHRVVRDVLVRRQDEPQRQHPERHQADEEEHHHRTQLPNHPKILSLFSFFF